MFYDSTDQVLVIATQFCRTWWMFPSPNTF